MKLKKMLAVAIMILFISVNLIPSTANMNTQQSMLTTLSGTTFYVGGSGPGNYTKIQEAIDNATKGDTVYVYDDSSPYYENVVVNKTINLIGEDKNTTIVDAKKNGSSIIIQKANYTLITGFTVQNSGNSSWKEDAGLQIIRSYNNTVNGIKSINNYNGIFVLVSQYNIVTDVIVINNSECGIYLEMSPRNNIKSSVVKTNGIVGMSIQASPYATISQCYVSNNRYAGIESWNGFKNDFFENVIANEDIGLIHGDILDKIHKNNFLNNRCHATFHYFLINRFLIPFFIYPFQLNKWRNNYWEGHHMGPKIILGKFGPFDYENIAIPWLNFDFLPAQEPHDFTNFGVDKP